MPRGFVERLDQRAFLERLDDEADDARVQRARDQLAVPGWSTKKTPGVCPRSLLRPVRQSGYMLDGGGRSAREER